MPPGSAGYPIAPYVINPQEPYALIAAGNDEWSHHTILKNVLINQSLNILNKYKKKIA